MNIRDTVQHIPEQVKVAGDVTSVATVSAALMGWLPAIAALVTIIWTGIRIYETDTVQNWLKKRKEK